MISKRKNPTKAKPTKSKLRDALDAAFSRYIRMRYADANGYCRCISCGKIHHWTKIQCGHYMSRRYMSTRFSEDNCRPQCVACNIFNQGNAPMYRISLVSQLGEDRVKLLEARALSEVRKFSEFEYSELTKYYKALFDKIKKEKGL